jgi:hypothetical protein
MDTRDMDTRDPPYWLLVLPMVAAGSGMTLTMPAATTAAMDGAPGGRPGPAAGMGRDRTHHQPA